MDGTDGIHGFLGDWRGLFKTCDKPSEMDKEEARSSSGGSERNDHASSQMILEHIARALETIISEALDEDMTLEK